MSAAVADCGTCRFWHEMRSGFEHGECRRRAPAAFIGLYGDGDQPTHYASWPQTFVEDWCGEHEARPS